jgi:hypothetical protein
MIISRYSIPIVLLVVGLCACQDSPVPPPMESPTSSTAPPAASLPPLTSAATLGCGVPAMPDLHNTCPKIQPRYSDDVVAAVNHIIATRPDLFDPQDPTRKVADHRGYTNAVVERLRTMGYCAADQLEEIAVKRTNEFNEQYNIWTSLGYVRQAYITTCFPAQF